MQILSGSSEIAYTACSAEDSPLMKESLRLGWLDVGSGLSPGRRASNTTIRKTPPTTVTHAFFILSHDNAVLRGCWARLDPTCIAKLPSPTVLKRALRAYIYLINLATIKGKSDETIALYRRDQLSVDAFHPVGLEVVVSKILRNGHDLSPACRRECEAIAKAGPSHSKALTLLL